MAVEPLVAAPDGLLAEAWVRAPDADTMWQQVQHDVGGVVALVPPSCVEAAAALSGFDAHLARLVDGKGTFYVVLAAGASPAEVGWAAALPLTDSTRAAETLFDASGLQVGGPGLPPRWVAGMRVLEAGAGPPSETVALAGPWLVVASSKQDLARLGPYAARAMPTKVAPGSAAVEVSVPAAALAGVVSTQLLSRWAALRSWLAARDEEQRVAHGGRAPDFADPRAILDAADGVVRRRIGVVAMASAARIELGTDEGDLRADVLLAPGPDDAGAGAFAALRPGPAEPLAEVPADAVVAILVRDDAAGRADDARAIEAALDRALGSRARPEDTAAIQTALDDWAHERGDWITASLAWGGDSGARGLWLRTPAAGDGASRALREIVQLSHRHAFEALLAAQAMPEGRLSDDPRTARLVRGLGGDVVLALIARPLRFDPARASGDAGLAPAVLALGRRGGDAWLRVELGGALLHELVRLKAGL